MTRAYGSGLSDRIMAGNATPAEEMLADAAADLVAACRELLADKYLSDPIDADRMKNVRAALARAEGGAA